MIDVDLEATEEILSAQKGDCDQSSLFEQADKFFPRILLPYRNKENNSDNIYVWVTISEISDHWHQDDKPSEPDMEGIHNIRPWIPFSDTEFIDYTCWLVYLVYVYCRIKTGWRQRMGIIIHMGVLIVDNVHLGFWIKESPWINHQKRIIYWPRHYTC